VLSRDDCNVGLDLFSLGWPCGYCCTDFVGKFVQYYSCGCLMDYVVSQCYVSSLSALPTTTLAIGTPVESKLSSRLSCCFISLAVRSG